MSVPGEAKGHTPRRRAHRGAADAPNVVRHDPLKEAA
jgi:hypothetical protein